MNNIDKTYEEISVYKAGFALELRSDLIVQGFFYIRLFFEDVQEFPYMAYNF